MDPHHWAQTRAWPQQPLSFGEIREAKEWASGRLTFLIVGYRTVLNVLYGCNHIQALTETSVIKKVIGENKYMSYFVF